MWGLDIFEEMSGFVKTSETKITKELDYVE